MPNRRRNTETCGDEQLVSGGIADPLGKEDQPKESRPDCSLERARSEIITALHQAKQELAKEMEANLVQLKAVLQETQRIAKDMEAVLREAKAEPDPQEQARGDGGQDQQQGQKRSTQEGEGWNPPSFKQSKQPPHGAWEPPNFDQEQPSAH